MTLVTTNTVTTKKNITYMMVATLESGPLKQINHMEEAFPSAVTGYTLATRSMMVLRMESTSISEMMVGLMWVR